MNIEVMKKELNEYFEYIKAIFINEFSKYMTTETKERIKKIENVIELKEESQFKVTCSKKIIFNLDLKSYIEENDLKNEKNLSDLSEDSKSYVNYLIKNEENVYEIIKNKLLYQILNLFINNFNDVLSLGTIKLIEDKLVKKYKLPSEQFITSKEKEVAIYFREIVGEDILLSGIINNNHKIIESKYNAYSRDDEDEYNLLTKEINQIYQKYNKKIGKVFFTDTLYEYDKLDYGIIEKSEILMEEKRNVDMNKLKRLSSIKQSLINISQHKFLFTALEIKELESSLYLINEILNKIMQDGKEGIFVNIEKEYEKVLEIENDCMKFVQKIWTNTLSIPDNYKMGADFNFLISQNEDDIIKATYISSEHLKNIRSFNNTYGFIYEPIMEGIVYSSTSNVVYKKMNNENYIPNHNTLYVNKNPIEVIEQADSKLITPNMILKNNLNKKTIQNNIILDSSKVRRTGIYCFVGEDLENDSNYNKALELGEIYNLPIIKIFKDAYLNNLESSRMEIEVEEIEDKVSLINNELNEATKTI